MSFGCVCWFCHWGWPRVVVEIYQRAKADIDALGVSGENAMQFGPGHIVWSDENFDRHSVEWCIQECDTSDRVEDYGRDAIDIVKRSLQELNNVPDAWRDEPSGYDGENPQNFPPPVEAEFIRNKHR